MSEHDEPEHRAHHDPDPEHVEVRQPEDEPGMFAVRMPIASTGEVRNEGDDPLDREALDGMAEQIDAGQVGVFPEHGADTSIAGGRYAQREKVGYWADAEVEQGAATDGEDLLVAEARLPDPGTLPEETGPYRETLAIYKAQVERGIALSSSIGWREDESFPGGNDLMEASIVGIGADPRTTSQDAQVEAVARAAVEAGADRDALVERVRDVVLGPDDEQEADMSDDEDTETQSGEQPDDTTDEEPEAGRKLRLLEEIHDAVVEDDDDGRDAESGEEPDESEGGDDAEQTADEPDDEQDADVSEEVRELREELEELRDGGVDTDDVDTPDPDEEQGAETDDVDADTEERGTESEPSFGFTEADE